MSKHIKDYDQRKSRAKEQKIFLVLTHEYDDDILERVYEVMGTTGNVYTVTINNIPSCTCPDYVTRSRRCKHIYFVLTRIMKVHSDKEDIEKYSNDDLRNMFEHIPQITESLKVDVAKLDKYKTLKKNKNGEVKMREITEEDVCPICLTEFMDESMDESESIDDSQIVYCKYSCGNCIHKQCFDMYNLKRTDIKCIFCLQSWNPPINAYIKL